MTRAPAPSSGPIVIHGAGSIGTYAGLAWQHEGADIRLLGRPWLEDAAREAGGLTISDCHGREATIAFDRLTITSDAAILANARLVVLAVKATALDGAIAELRKHCPRETPILSLQNGLGPLETLRAALPEHKVLGGVVTHNVVIIDGRRFHKATAGSFLVEASPRLTMLEPLSKSSFAPVEFSDDFPSVRWGKLLINLNNAVNAVSGLGLRAQLGHPRWRRMTAQAIREGLAVARAESVRPAKAGILSPQRLAMLLSLPEWLFAVARLAFRNIDDTARSSMADDILSGRKTEIDTLNAAIVALAERHSLKTPINRWLVDQVRLMQVKNNSFLS